MSFDRNQIKDLIKRTLKKIDLYSETAVNLLLGTAAQESAFGTYLRQLGGGPAKGVFQMEPATEADIWDNYLKYRPEIVKKIAGVTRVDHPDAYALESNLAYQIAMTRIHYLRVPEKFPAPDDIIGLARYWKEYYNTQQGAGTEREFVNNYYKYVMN